VATGRELGGRCGGGDGCPCQHSVQGSPLQAGGCPLKPLRESGKGEGECHERSGCGEVDGAASGDFEDREGGESGCDGSEGKEGGAVAEDLSQVPSGRRRNDGPCGQEVAQAERDERGCGGDQCARGKWFPVEQGESGGLEGFLAGGEVEKEMEGGRTPWGDSIRN
jgi:hypothetical protein